MPGQQQDIHVGEKIRKCDRCVMFKTPEKLSSEHVNIKSYQALDLECNLSLEKSKCVYENVLVLTNHFTRYARAFPTRNRTA